MTVSFGCSGSERERTPGSREGGGRLVIGVVIGLSYYLASEMLANSGQVFNFDPAVIAWLPSALLAVITVYALNRIR